MQNLLQARTTLYELVKDELGQFSNDTEAFWVEPPSLDANLECNGLQAILNRYEQIRQSRASVSTSQSIELFDWKFTLVNFDITPAGMEKMDRAVDKIRRSFPLRRERSLESHEDVFPQITFFLEVSRVQNCLPQGA